MLEVEQKTATLRKALDESRYTVVLCGSGMLEEAGYLMLKKPTRAYEIEEKYGVSPEYIFSDGYYSTRTDKFFEFYKKEILLDIPPTESAYCLARMESAGAVNCIISSNIYENCGRAGCQNVIDLHGSVYHNKCVHCGKEYSIDDIRQAKGVPRCTECGSVIRPQVSLFGDMLDGQMIARTASEIEKADVLLVLGTTLDSEVFRNYIKYFSGSRLILVNKEEHIKDRYADLVIHEQPKEVLLKLGY